MRSTAILAGALAGAALLAGCGQQPQLRAADDGRLDVVTTTGILADVVRNVAGDRARVVSLIPDGADPHSYEPTLRDIRNVVYADVAFTNYLLLEEHRVIKALDANLRPGTPNIALAEEAVKYAAEIIPLVENISLDTVWLGLRVRGKGSEYGATRASNVHLSATAMNGPGDLVGYLTSSFGDTEVYFDSRDGFDADVGYRDDTTALPPDAHTHMSWVFTEPGIYELDLAAKLQVAEDSKPVPIAEGTFTFAVGVDPASTGRPRVVDEGHADLAVDVDAGELTVFVDPHGGGEATQVAYDPAETVIEVPNRAVTEVPGDPAYRFLGRAGTRIFQLPQAVLGRHVHGEIDPHLWQDVGNVQSYAEAIRDTLIEQDPEGTATYLANTRDYLAELDELDAYVRARIGEIPESRRHLITTHDAFAYLGRAYDVTISGFVTPNPATEPSLADRKRLTDTIRNLGVPAVFLEPNLAARSTTLEQVAREQGIEVCTIHGDAFTGEVDTYVELMRANAESLNRCL